MTYEMTLLLKPSLGSAQFGQFKYPGSTKYFEAIDAATPNAGMIKPG